jgi:hypothetical protein
MCFRANGLTETSIAIYVGLGVTTVPERLLSSQAMIAFMVQRIDTTH